MQQCSALVILAFLALAVAQDVPAGAAPEATAAALGSDDECSAEYGAAGSGGCALSALQLRVKKQQEEQVQQKEQAQQEEQQEQAQQEEQARQEDEVKEVEEEVAEDEPPAELAPPENASLLETMFATSPHCFSYTGATCVTDHCAPWRHATCYHGKCICAHGCAGADGKCYHHHNRLIAKGVLLRNAKYTHYKMYFQRFSTFGQMKTTRASSWMNMKQDKFDIYEVPGSDSGHKEYFLASSKWRDYVVGMKATTGTALSPFAAYAVNLHSKGGIFDAWGLSNIMLRVCETANGMLQVGAKMSDAKMIWAYVHHGSWYVYGSVSSPGWGGEWKPEPALPQSSFPPCHHHSHHHR